MKCLSALLIVCAGLGFCADAAKASSCADQIAQLETNLSQSEAHHDAGLTAPQSVGAQLHHQPTPASVDRARERALDTVDVLLSEAKELDANGKSAACMKKVDEIKSIFEFN